MKVRDYILSNKDFRFEDDIEIRNIRNSKLIRLDTVEGIFRTENLQNCEVEKVDSYDRHIIYINENDMKKAITVKTKISNDNTYVATIPCDTDDKAQEITDAYTRAFKQSMVIIGENPNTVSSSYTWVR